MVSYGYYAVERDSITLTRGTYSGGTFTADDTGTALQLVFSLKLTDGTHSSGYPTVSAALYMRRDYMTPPYPDMHISSMQMTVTSSGNQIVASCVFITTSTLDIYANECLCRIDVSVTGYEVRSGSTKTSVVTDTLSIPYSTIPPLIRGDETGFGLGIGIPVNESLDPDTVTIRDRFFINTAMSQYSKAVQELYDTLWPVGTVIQHFTDSVDNSDARSFARSMSKSIIKQKVYGGGTIVVLKSTWTVTTSIPVYTLTDTGGTRHYMWYIERTL